MLPQTSNSCNTQLKNLKKGKLLALCLGTVIPSSLMMLRSTTQARSKSNKEAREYGAGRMLYNRRVQMLGLRLRSDIVLDMGGGSVTKPPHLQQGPGSKPISKNIAHFKAERPGHVCFARAKRELTLDRHDHNRLLQPAPSFIPV